VKQRTREDVDPLAQLGRAVTDHLRAEQALRGSVSGDTEVHLTGVRVARLVIPDST
jgi:hypothetical protein